jgi:hypothetical protein
MGDPLGFRRGEKDRDAGEEEADGSIDLTRGEGGRRGAPRRGGAASFYLAGWCVEGKEGEVGAIDEAAPRPGEGNDELGRAGEVAGCVWGPCPLGGENKREAPCAWWRRPVALLDSLTGRFPVRLGWCLVQCCLISCGVWGVGILLWPSLFPFICFTTSCHHPHCLLPKACEMLC